MNVTIPDQELARDPLFDPTALDPISDSVSQRETKIVMTWPEQPPISGLVEASVVYDNTRPRGVGLNIRGAMGADLQLEVLEEICRRGGAFGLAGRVWAKSHRIS